MRISDAEEGDVLRDRHGDLWLAVSGGVYALTVDGKPPRARAGVDCATGALEATEYYHGPFARLLPEKVEPNANQ